MKHGFFGLLCLAMALFISVTLESQEERMYEMIATIPSLVEAEQIEKDYGIELLAYSRFGLAKYHVKGEKTFASLIALKDYLFEENLGYAPGQVTVNDPHASKQYALEMLRLPDAWTITMGSHDVTVAVIDTGIDIYHEDLRHNISPLSYNATQDQVGLEHVIDVDGHGTMVSGVITAAKNNGLGIAGAAPGVTLLVIKSELNDNGYFSWFDLAEAIFYATFNGADIINMSLGGGRDSGNVRRAIETATNQGIIVVAAAGNSASSIPEYPAAFPNTVGVSSVNQDSQLSGFSNTGIRIRVAAPGERIYTTLMGVGSETTPSNRYGYVNGTSFSAPYASAVLALILSHFPHLNRQETLNQLYRSSIDLGEPGFDEVFGHGLIQAYNALHEVVSVTLVPNQGDAPLNRYITTNQAALFEAPTHPGHTFLGWFLDSLLTEPFEAPHLFEDVTLYAGWTPNTYTVSFNTHGGRFVMPESVVFGSEWTPVTPIRPGYQFLGWYEDFSASTQPFTGDLPPNDVTLYARWLAADYQFSLKPGIDTIIVGAAWLDAGVHVSDHLTVVSRGVVDTETVGRYNLFYDLFYENRLINQLHRVVHVVEPAMQLNLTLSRSPSILEVGTDYVEVGAESTLGQVMISGAVDQAIPGVYDIRYSVTHDGYYTERVRRVRVVEAFESGDMLAIVPKNEMERRWMR